MVNSLRVIRRGLIAATFTVFALAGVATAHNVQSITASSDCSGVLTVTVKADVYGGHILIVKEGSTVLLDDVDNGSDTSVRTWNLTGSGFSGSVTATIYQPNGTTVEAGPLVAYFQSPECPSPTPSASPSPSPTPTPSPSPTPSASPSPTPSTTPGPSATPRPTPPATATAAGDYAVPVDSSYLFAVAAALFAAAFALAFLTIARRERR